MKSDTELFGHLSDSDVQAQGGEYLVVTDLEELHGFVEEWFNPKGKCD